MARRKPLEAQKGHLTKEQQEEKKMQEENINVGAEQLKRAPVWLRDNVAKKEWKRLLVQFDELGFLTNLDYNNLGAYCNAYSYYVESTEKMKSESLTVTYVNKRGQANTVENPLIRIQLKYSEEMKKYSSLLGLTIDSRLKFADLKIKKQKDVIEEEFGDL